MAGRRERRPEAKGARQRDRPTPSDRDDRIDVRAEENPKETPEELGPNRRHVAADEEDERLTGDLEGGHDGDEGAGIGRRVADDPESRAHEGRQGRAAFGRQDDDDLAADVGDGRHGVGEERPAADLDGELVGAEAGRPTTGQDDARGGELDAVRGVRRPGSVGGRGGRHR